MRGAGMAVPVTIPKLGLTMEEGTITEWEKKTGDQVSKGDILYTLETDKIANEVEAEVKGFLQQAADVDSTHEVGAVVGYIHETKEAALSSETLPAASAPSKPEAADAVENAADQDPMASPALAGGNTMRADTSDGRILISPVARRIAEENGLSLFDLDKNGSGPGGAILKSDVERRIAEGAKRPAAAPATPASATKRPLKGMRRTIASRMMQSIQGTAQMTAFTKVEMTETVKLRNALAEMDGELGIRVTYTDILVKTVATVLVEMPKINSAIVGDEIVEWADANVGIAVALDDGLIVPVVQQANAKSLLDCARDRKRLVTDARSGMLSSDDISGGTFSVSNFGSYGGDFETPILNPPQSAILGFGQIVDEPVVREGEIVIRPMMMLSMTFDHRLIDGADAGNFRKRLKCYLENPSLQWANLK